MVVIYTLHLWRSSAGLLVGPYASGSAASFLLMGPLRRAAGGSGSLLWGLRQAAVTGAGLTRAEHLDFGQVR